MTQFKKMTIKNWLWLLFLIIFFFSVSLAVAQNKVVIIPLFNDHQTGGAPAPIPRTGQTTSYETGDDGDFQKGVAWPNPRFADNEDGTVTDNLTGLIWMKQASCFGQKNWYQALSDCNTLADGSCGLSDGSSAGDWRLPNLREILSLFHYGVFLPTLSDTAGTGKWSEGDPFDDVVSYYWSSTIDASNTENAWLVLFYFGDLFRHGKNSNYYFWCMHDGN